MFRISPKYRIPLAIALVLHFALFLFLFAQLPAQHFRSPGPVSKTEPVQAVAVDQKAVMAQVAKIQHQQVAQNAREVARVKRLEAKARTARQARLREQRRLSQLKAQHIAMKKKQALALKRQKALKAKQRQLQQKLIKQEMLAEQQRLASAQAKARALQQQGQLDRYKAAILKAIGQHWVIPGGADQSLSTIYWVQLAPGGGVLNVKLLSSSGSVALDHSARAAIFKASPLPVPKDPALFDNFRELRLTVSPKTVVKENASIQ